jgi:uncharacterized Zn finger protein (UPF0148 family)
MSLTRRCTKCGYSLVEDFNGEITCPDPTCTNSIYYGERRGLC